jgi:magnesium transporter
VIFGGETPDSKATKALQQELFNIRRDLLSLQHKVQPLAEVAERLKEGEIEWIGTSNRNDFENLRNHVLRASDQLTNQTELVKSEVDALLSLSSQRMNEIMKTMTGWGSILLGAALIAGIYGMNFTHMPELSWYFGYPTAIGLMLVLTFALFVFLKKRDWL